MSKCPKLESKYNGLLSWSSWVCELTGVEMKIDDTKVKNLCDCDNGYAYENCPVYKNR